MMHWTVIAILWTIQSSDAKSTSVQPMYNLTRTSSVVPPPADVSVGITIDVKRRCKISPSSEEIRNVIAKTKSAKLLEYELEFANYTVNPLKEESMRENYRANLWQKASTNHGRALVTMSFNFDVLSLTMLSLGVERHSVELKDDPIGCFGELSEMDKMDTVLWLVSRDFDPESFLPTIAEDDYICHQVFHTRGSIAKFVDKCCGVDIHRNMTCATEFRSMTLDVLMYFMMALKIVVFLFAPCLIPRSVYMFSRGFDTFRIKLKSTLQKKILVALEPGDIRFDQRWPAQALGSFKRFQGIVESLPNDKPVNVTFSEYYVRVASDRVITEDHLPIGPFACFKYRILLCGIRKFKACVECCNASICGLFKKSFSVKWKHIGYILSGLILVTLVIPFPFWIRWIFFEIFEREELSKRSEFANKFGLIKAYELHLVQYFFPESTIFIICYVMYAMFIILHVFFKIQASGVYRNIVKSSFIDMHRIPVTTIIGKMVEFLLKPCRFLGCLGLIVSFVFWPIAVPICLVSFILSCAPLLHLTYRFFTYMYTEVSSFNTKIPQFEHSDTPNIGIHPTSTKLRGWISQVHCIFLSCVYVFGIWCTMFLTAECFGFGLEVLILTLIGLIVNAGSVLKYLSILFLLIIYSYDCFNNVYMQYLSLNKAIFKDVFGRVKDDASEVTQLPSHLQENRGFKAEAVSEQDEQEITDMLSKTRPMHWDINDLVLFVNKFDLLFVPVKLFYAITKIKVAGAPGPVLKSMFYAWIRFGQIVIFLVFLVMTVSIFGGIYNVGSTNQMLATLAGGIFPFVLRNLMSSKAEPIELNSCTFKCKVDEVIENFKEDWPMADFPFEIDEDQTGVESCKKVDLFIQLPKGDSSRNMLLNMAWRGKYYDYDQTRAHNGMQEANLEAVV